MAPDGDEYRTDAPVCMPPNSVIRTNMTITNDYYFKKTWSGMVLMVLICWEDDGRPAKEWRKATEYEAQEFGKWRESNEPN